MNKRRIALAIITLALLLTATAAFSFRSRYEQTRRQLAADSASVRVLAEFFSLDTVPPPSVLSSYWLVRSAESFRAAPIHIVLYGDPLCSDCRVLFQQMKLLEREFSGQLNVVYQFFPLEARCNDVVAKDKHPGACDLSYMMAAQPDRFRVVHDEILENMDSAKTPGWRARFARRHGLESALADSALQLRVRTLIRTGSEYAPTSSKYQHGIRSTPTLIVNGRMIIGTLPLDQLRAIFQGLLHARRMEERGFIESWINPGCSIESEATQCGVP